MWMMWGAFGFAMMYEGVAAAGVNELEGFVAIAGGVARPGSDKEAEADVIGDEMGPVVLTVGVTAVLVVLVVDVAGFFVAS